MDACEDAAEEGGPAGGGEEEGGEDGEWGDDGEGGSLTKALSDKQAALRAMRGELADVQVRSCAFFCSIHSICCLKSPPWVKFSP